MEVLENLAPYKHVLVSNFFHEKQEAACLEVLSRASWKERHGSFFRFQVPTTKETYEMLDTHLNDALIGNVLQERLEDIFSLRLKRLPEFEIHRYGEHDGIGPHTDSSCTEVRCVINVSAEWALEEDGVWILARDCALTDGALFLPSISNTGFAFFTSTNSFHARTLSKKNSTYSITIRFTCLFA